ncbi:MAG: 1,4-dihydroxy-2-naphthoate polyprenyltransferase [Actinomycetales bacterium]|nr:1,4-dihydroxy-2-naphthoate polyprenyltransferase [Actinomycetales bacterium]
MTSPSRLRLWIAGARPKTLPAAIAPVLVGTGAAYFANGAVWWKALLALGVSLSLQIGVNYANDYSDGIKGSDDDRVGPLRLVGSGLVPAKQVKVAAFGFLGLGALFGLALAATSSWWLLLVGGAALFAAWGYTGGSNPYGYRALGELSVFLFFGLVAVLGTTFVQLGTVTLPAIAGSIGIGALACVILVANNLRDRAKDELVNKVTLAVALGDKKSRLLFAGLNLLAILTLVALIPTTWWALLGLAALPWMVRSTRAVLGGAEGQALIAVLGDTGRAELFYALGLTIGLLVA